MKGRVLKQARPLAPTERFNRQPTQTRVLSGRVLAALREAEQIVATAQAEAQQLLATAEAQAHELRQQVIQQAQVQAVQLVGEAHDSARQQLETLIEQTRDQLTGLAVDIARKLLGAELELTPERVADVATEALRHVQLGSSLVVRAHRLDVEALRAALAQLHDTSGAHQIDVRADPKVSRGGCVISGSRGEVDAQLETQLMRLAELLPVEPAG